MPLDWTEADVACPYFRKIRRDHREIVCDPIDGAAAVSALRFSATAAMSAYMRDRCCSVRGCQLCPRYRFLEGETESP